MKVLIADKLPGFVATELAALGAEVVDKPGATAESLPDVIGDANVLVVRSTVVSAATLARGTDLTLVIRAGSGTNTIDVAEASRRGVYVANCPGKNATAVAELAMGLILAIDRRIPDNVAALRRHEWKKKEFGKADGLKGKTIGVVGLGAIGREMLVRARAFGMKPVACERALSSIKAAGLNVEECSTIDEVCSVADIVSLHVPLTPETRGLIGRPQLEALKPGAILVNTSRGGLIDREAMLWALETKGLRVGLDVYDDEPAGGEGTITDPIVDHPQVYGTHHIGASTQQAQDAVADEVVSMIASFMQRGEVPNVVNLAAETPAKWQLVVRHMDRVGVLANVLDVLKRNEINVQEIENIVFDGAHAASCRIRVDTKPGDEVLSTLRSFGDDIFGVQLVAVPKAAPTA